MDIWSYLQGFGNVEWSGVFVTLATVLYWIFDRFFGLPKVVSNIFYKVLDMFLKEKIKDIRSVNSIKESDVFNHDIFNYIDYWTYNRVPTLQFKTEYRTAVFRKYLKILLQKHKSNLLDWIQSKNFEEMDNSQLWDNVLSVMNKIIFDYETEMEKNGIPLEIIEKMKVRSNDTISLTIDLLESICKGQFYDSEKNLLKVYSILNILLCVLEFTISSSEKMCNSINGQLSGLTFEGKTEP
jgi:hypothetical protein